MTRAATVVLLRDAGEAPEVLLLRRSPASRAFPGAWVFPGGAVEPGDGPPGDERASRRAAVRETAEEAGLAVSTAGLTPWSSWRPPAEAPIRFETDYFVGAAPDQAVAIDGVEIVDFVWCAAAVALARHARAELDLMPPTWVTLTDLAAAGSVAEVLASAPAEPPTHATRIRRAGGRTTLSWDSGRELDITERPWQLSPPTGAAPAKENSTR